MGATTHILNTATMASHDDDQIASDTRMSILVSQDDQIATLVCTLIGFGLFNDAWSQ